MKSPSMTAFVRRFPPVLPMLVFVILLGIGARAHPLWADEAEIANFARNITRFGIPTGWDGFNIIGSQQGVVLNSKLVNTSNSWLEMYLMASSFTVFGVSSFVARLPFVAVSVFSLYLLYVFATLYSGSRRIGFLTILLASVSVPLLLYSYQARYVSLTVCFGLLMLLGMHRKSDTSVLGSVGRVIGGVGLIAANYFSGILMFSVTPVVLLLMNVFLPESRNRLIRLRTLLVSLALSAAIYLPFYLYLRPLEQRSFQFTWDTMRFIGFIGPSTLRVLRIFSENSGYPFMVAVILIGMLFLYRKRAIAGVPWAVVFIGLFLAMYMCAVVLLSAATVGSSRYLWIGDFRYHVILIPLAYVLTAIGIDRVFSHNKQNGIIIVLLFMLWNGSPSWPGFLLGRYIYDGLFPYPTPDQAVAEYLRPRLHWGDTVFINLERNLEPMIFHLGGLVRLVNRLDRTNARFFPANKDRLPTYIYNFRDLPDWIIYYGTHNQDEYDYRRSVLFTDVHLATQYEKTVIPVYYRDTTRPELDTHRFSGTKPDTLDRIIIYRRRK